MLRRLLTFVGVPVWKHFYTGLSRLFIYGIDMYMKTLSPTMRSTAGERAHYVLNISRPWYLRKTVVQENWWLCRDWLFNGQLDPHFDRAISDPRLVELAQTIVRDPRTGMSPFFFLFFWKLFVCAATCVLFLNNFLRYVSKSGGLSWV